MFGKVVDYEARRIWNEGRDLGRQEAMEERAKIEEEIDTNREEREKIIEENEKALEESAKDMIRDKMDFSLIEKYTNLSQLRIKELAQELGYL